MNKISNILLGVLSLVLALTLGACSKDKYQEPVATFKVLTNTLSDSKDASVGLVTLSEGGFKYSVSADWCTATLKNETTLELSLTANSSAEMRSCIVTLSKGETEILVPVHQMGVVYGVEDLEDFAIALAGGSERFKVVGGKTPTVTYASPADWLTYRVENGELIFTAPALTGAASRQVSVTVKTELFSRTILVSQRIARTDLLGAYTLDFITEYGDNRQTADVELVEASAGKFELRGLSLPVAIDIAPNTFKITMKTGSKSKPAGLADPADEVILLAWGAGYPKADNTKNYSLTTDTMIGTWDLNAEHPKFTFAPEKADATVKGISFNVIGGNAWKSFYSGSVGFGTVVDFSITKK